MRKIHVLGSKCENNKLLMKKEKDKRQAKNFGLAFITL